LHGQLERKVQSPLGAWMTLEALLTQRIAQLKEQAAQANATEGQAA
jgi:hypothetical protein